MPGTIIEVTFPEVEITLRFNTRAAAYKVISAMEVKLANPASLVGTYTDDGNYMLVVSTEKLRNAIIYMRDI